MYPWLWLWAPQFHFPFSGNLTQDIEPNTSWFSELIQPPAGNPRIEQKAFDVASYGKQLGQITDVLMEVVKSVPVKSPEAVKSLESLRVIKKTIEGIKAREYATAGARLAAELSAMRERGGAEYQAVAKEVRLLLAGSAP